ncbi:stage V sporulation protein K domain-containing protein [Phanerochaete sordida]|uniref:Stage V sporulation protein K domain-containing protein n=1 Tax=Phanerochaete sordida TaxID=48140 RepID=A0A9P3LF00_9APHY|nr:stage V sporulation protein K domain-containing protein [Phanerochaete sordida]
MHYLLSLPQVGAKPYHALARTNSIAQRLITSTSYDVRELGHHLKYMLETDDYLPVTARTHPGGRHDNDHANIRQISILPTPDEIMSKDPPFLLTAAHIDSLPADQRAAAHVDNQFRLLREDMLHELREQAQIASGRHTGTRGGLILDDVQLVDGYGNTGAGTSGSAPAWGLAFRMQPGTDLWFFQQDKPKKRKQYLLNHTELVQDGSLAAVIVGGAVVAVMRVHRDVDHLSKTPPELILLLDDQPRAKDILCTLRTQRCTLALGYASASSHVPVLEALQQAASVPLIADLALWGPGTTLDPPPNFPEHVVTALHRAPTEDLQYILGSHLPVKFDDAETQSIVSCLTNRVSLVQAPPGTSASLIAAAVSKVCHGIAGETIVVCCPDDDALLHVPDSFDALGILQDHVVRLGANINPSQSSAARCTQNASSLKDLRSAFKLYLRLEVSHQDLMDHLEFADAEFYHAFQECALKAGAPCSDVVDSWKAGVTGDVQAISPIWTMPAAERRARAAQWHADIVREHAEQVVESGAAFCEAHRAACAPCGPETQALSSPKIIVCTSEEAAKYSKKLREVSPTTVLVVDADRMLEGQILALLSETTRRLVMIGDHKQPRPKIRAHALTVDRGEGYDLDRSLFERLVFRGYPHTVLQHQHHIQPQLASYLRHLAYPELLDGPSAQRSTNIPGLADNVLFISHGSAQAGHDKHEHGRDEADKDCAHETQMVVKTVQHLLQNKNSADDILVLTPCIDQLHRLQKAFQAANIHPTLNMDDPLALVCAGRLSPGAAKPAKAKVSVRLRTIGNCRRERCGIALVSLARSHHSRTTGLPSSPAHLNAVLSCPRDALVVFGNAEALVSTTEDGEHWRTLFAQMKAERRVYDGLPVPCQRHPGQALKRPEDFRPHGGCDQPCASLLQCSVHRCRLKCTSQHEHSSMLCKVKMRGKCPSGHVRTYKCHQRTPPPCLKCKKAKETVAQEHEKCSSEPAPAETIPLSSPTPSLSTDISAPIHHDEPSAALVTPDKDGWYTVEGPQNTGQSRVSSPARSSSAVPNSPPNEAESDDYEDNSYEDDSTTASDTSTISSSSSSLPASRPGSPQRIARLAPIVDDTTSPLPASQAEQEWRRQKEAEGADNSVIDAIMQMTGLEQVKVRTLSFKAKIETLKRQRVSISDELFNIVLRGNPGTGKTTIARYYAKLLRSLDILPHGTLETTGSRLADDGVAGAKQQIETLKDCGGGALFIDEAYQLTSAQSYGGRQVLDFLLGEMEKNVGKIVFIVAGYTREMDKFFEHNPGLSSRIPHSLQFADYTDAELLHMLGNLITKRYHGNMKVEGGMYGLYTRIAVRRLGRGRGRAGFGNARALRNMLAIITERQASRIAEERKTGAMPDDFFLGKEDIIGPDPSKAVLRSAAWKQLEKLTGLTEVKQSVQNLVDLIAENYKRELAEKEPIQMSLNRVFLGNPGTGKTTVARLFGQILADIGLLSNGEVVLKNPADFIGGALGQSEQNTKAILSATSGKVLVIDEAYSLYGGGGKQNDSYKTAVIDAIVSEVQSVPGEDRCVLMCGYESQMREMFQNVNPGLSRRFAIEDAFRFSDFTDAELREILDLKLKSQDLDATLEAKDVAIDMLARARNRPNFGNGGEVENMLGKAKNNHRSRQSKLPASQRYDVVFEPVDFDPNYNRAQQSGQRLKKLFEDLVGCETIVEQLQHYQDVVRVLKQRGGDVQKMWSSVPTTFVFRGPPGTGKTTVARRMGQVYYDMGFLSSPEVVECSTSDLVGQHVGHTGPKTKELFRRALGKVLFIDEAYRLSEGSFAKEAVEEIVGLLSGEAAGKLIVILAGYKGEMDAFLAVNPGLSSRFPEKIDFCDISPAQGLNILRTSLAQEDIECKGLTSSRSKHYKQMALLIAQLSSLDSWGNARDMKTLSRQMVGLALKRAASAAPKSTSKLSLPGADAISCIGAMLQDRGARARNTLSRSVAKDALLEQCLGPQEMGMPKVTQSRHAAVAKIESPNQGRGPSSSRDGRDLGISDADWNQLQTDKCVAQEASRSLNEELRQLAHDARVVCEAERKVVEARWQRKLEEKHKEERVQKKIREMGLCPYGYEWIKQQGGYRCSGGTHFVSNSELGL